MIAFNPNFITTVVISKYSIISLFITLIISVANFFTIVTADFIMIFITFDVNFMLTGFNDLLITTKTVLSYLNFLSIIIQVLISFTTSFVIIFKIANGFTTSFVIIFKIADRFTTSFVIILKIADSFIIIIIWIL